VIRFEVDTSELDKMQAWLTKLQGQLPYATSRALNDTARAMAADLNRSTLNYFDRPTPFTQKGYAVTRWSSKADPTAELNLKPIQRRYLIPSIYGGVRPQRPSEQRIGAIYNQAWRPGVDAKLNRFGNVPKATAVAALSGTSGRFFRVDQQKGKLWPGVYQRMAKGKVKNVLSFGKLPTIPQRWPVEAIARESLGRHWPVNLSKWLTETTRPLS